MSSTIGLKWVLTRLGAIGLGVGLVVGLATMPASASSVSFFGSCGVTVSAVDVLPEGGTNAMPGRPAGVDEWGYSFGALTDPCESLTYRTTDPGGGLVLLAYSYNTCYCAGDGATALPGASAPQGSSGGASYGSPGYSRDVAISLVDQVSNPVVDLMKNVLPILVPFLLALWAMHWVMKKFGLNRKPGNEAT